MAENQIERLNYYQGQYLRAQDFRDEQEYHRDLRRRHNLGQHTWGIVTGLELVEEDKEGGSGKDVFIQPGMAVDGYGREIVLFAAHKLDTQDFIRFTRDDHYAVWIAYQEEAVNRVEAGYNNCDDQANRTRETYRVFIEPLSPQPDGVVVDGRTARPPVDDDDPSRIPPDLSVPYQELPDDYRQRWMLRLGSVRWDGSQFVEAAAGKLSEGRLYTSAVVGRLLAPAASLVIQDRFTEPLAAGDPGVAVEVLGSLQVQRDITAKANLHIDGGMIDFRLEDGSQGEQFAIQRVESDTGYDLRLRIGTAEDGDNRLTVGPQTGATEDTFTAVLTVADNNTVGVRAGHPEHALQVGDGSAPVSLSVRGPDLDAAAAVIAFEDSAGTGSRWFKLGYDSNANLLKVSSAEVDPILVFERTTGQVGIGTTAPDRLLTLSGAEGTYLNVIADGGAHQVLLGADGNGGIVSTMTNHDLVLRAGGNSTKLVIKPDGDVGIGTSLPQARLHLVGGSDVTLADEGGYLVIGDVNGDNIALDSNEIQARLSGATSSLHVQAEGGDFRVHTNQATSTQVIVQDSGSVGIGTLAPAAKLHVIGSIRMDAGGNPMFALGGGLSLRLVAGSVSGSAADSGTGWASVRNGPGEYTVSFNPDFAGTPVVVASSSESDKDHIVTLGSVSSTGFTVSGRDVGNLNGDPQNTAFHFIAFGAV